MTEHPIQDADYLQTILDSLPTAVFLVDRGFNILDINSSATQLFSLDSDIILHRLCGEIMHCMHAIDSEDGCGTTDICPDCVVKNAVDDALVGEKTHRKKYEMKLRKGNHLSGLHMLVTASPLDYKGDKLVLLAMEDVTETVALKQLFPICSNCKKIRNDDNYWEAVTDYLAKHAGLDFTHSICPECVKELYPDLDVSGKR